MCVIQVPYEFPFIDDGVDWNCFHWYIDLKESRERERGREEENQFFAVIAAAAAPTPPPSKIFLATHHHYTAASSSSSQVPSHSQLAKWVTVASQVFNKRQEKGTRWVHDVWIMKWGWYLEYVIRIEYTWYWECVLLLLCNCMRICITIDWL